MEMSKEEFTATNVRNASTLTLFRNSRTEYSIGLRTLVALHVDGGKVPFFYGSGKGDGDDHSRVKELRDYIAEHVRDMEDLRGKVERSHRSKIAWKECNKGCRSRRKMFLEFNAAVVLELSLRENEEAEGARALKESTWLECSTPVLLFPEHYAADIARIHIELDAEDHGITKSSWGKNWSRHVPTPLNVETW